MKVINQEEIINISKEVVAIIQQRLKKYSLLNERNLNSAKAVFIEASQHNDSIIYCLAMVFQSIRDDKNKVYQINARYCTPEPQQIYIKEASDLINQANLNIEVKPSEMYIEPKENKITIVF